MGTKQRHMDIDSEKMKNNVTQSFHDDLAEEIILEQPSRMEKNFLWVFIVICIVFFTTSWLIKYPDTIECKTVLLSTELSQKLTTDKAHVIKNINVRNKEKVRAGQKIIEFQSDVNLQEMNEIKSMLSRFMKEPFVRDTLSAIVNKSLDYKELGELQLAFWKMSAGLNNLLKQNGNIVPDAYLTILSFLGEIKKWESSYTIHSTVDGTFYSLYPLNNGSHVPSDVEYGYITPSVNKYLFKIYIPQSSIYKVKLNMPIQISLDAYPEQEFGYISGTITKILNSSDSSVIGIVELPGGLITNRNISLNADYLIQGHARILLNNERLFNRIIKNFELKR